VEFVKNTRLENQCILAGMHLDKNDVITVQFLLIVQRLTVPAVKDN